ncbi:eukaryotic integral membrane protein-domain-containing protein [Xylogone sp. PMI_703]|nr:eukaryotic integral membrane protein-domain-containing protein [Xylogone sp. PMI_703]
MPPRLNIPPITRILLITLVSQSALNAAIRYRQWTGQNDIVVPYLVLVPQLSIIYPWTFALTSLVENNLFMLAISGSTLFYGGRYLERAWTSKEFAKFLAIVSILPNLFTFLGLTFLFAMTGSENYTLTTINGTIALQISFLVAFSQLVPAHTVTLFKGIVSLRVPRFPLLHVIAVLILTLTTLLSTASLFLVLNGFIISWTYLRFYKLAFPDLESSQSSTLRGDASETFAFAEFFPSPAKEVVASISDTVFNILVAVRICTPFSAADISAARGDNSFVQRGTPGTARAEAERRRALALKALDQRLHAASAKAAASAPPPSGPSVQVQPQPSTQTAMTSQPSNMLGETSYVPDREDDKGNH